jgi:hypothetical protein
MNKPTYELIERIGDVFTKFVFVYIAALVIYNLAR